MRIGKRTSATGRNARRTAIRSGVALVALLAATTNACAQGPVHFTRINASRLYIFLPGLAVIRDSAQWATLWRRWDWREKWSRLRGVTVDDTVPQIDFRHEMAIAISIGGGDACAARRYIGRIVEDGDSLNVSPPPGWLEPRLGCAWSVAPVDVVLLPRSDKRVVFHSIALGHSVPAASWWWAPSAADFEAADTAKQSAFAMALIVDPATPFATLEAITRYAAPDPILNPLLAISRPDVRTNVRLLTLLARSPAGDSAFAVLFRDFGTTVAADSSAPRDLLRRFTGHLWPWTGWSHDVAARLLENPTIAKDSQLVVTLITAVRDSDLRAAACRIYSAHWPDSKSSTRPNRAFIGSSPRVPCPSSP